MAFSSKLPTPIPAAAPRGVLKIKWISEKIKWALDKLKSLHLPEPARPMKCSEPMLLAKREAPTGRKVINLKG